MEALIFVGLQASGKSTFYKTHFFNTHLRISNDLLKTKHRERLLLNYCKDAAMPFVIDNTNYSKEVRRRYIDFCQNIGWTCSCYYFRTDLQRSLLWNEQRSSIEKVPRLGILGTHKKLETPIAAEGFRQIFYVDFEDGKLLARECQNEV
jgi:predicted kinase